MEPNANSTDPASSGSTPNTQNPTETPSAPVPGVSEAGNTLNGSLDSSPTNPLNTSSGQDLGAPAVGNPTVGVPVVGQPMDVIPDNGGSSMPSVSNGGKWLPKKKLLIGAVAAVLVASSIFGYVFGFYIPNKPANVYQTGLDRSGDTLTKLIDQVTSKERLEKLQNSELSAKVDAKAQDFTFNGTLGVKLSKSKADGGLDVRIKSGEEDEKSLNLKFLSDLPDNKKFPNFYFQVSGLTALGFDAFLPELAKVEGKWIAVDSDYLESIADASDAPKNRENITADEMASLIKVVSDTSNEYLLTSDKNKAVLDNKAFMGKETVDGIKAYHYQVGVNKPHAKDYCKALSERIITHNAYKKLLNLDDAAVEQQKKESSESCETDVDQSIKDDMTLDMWIDAKYKLIHKLRVYDEHDKGIYTDLGQTYTGGDKVSFFVAYHHEKNKTDAKFSWDVDMKASTSKGSLVWSQKSDNPYDVNVTFEAKPYEGEVKADKPANTISIQEVMAMLGYDQPAPSQPSNTPTTSVQSKAKDTERQTDIKAIHGQLEAYYVAHGIYPTQGDLNSTSWRLANMKGMDAEALKDPDGSTYTLATTATPTQYAYSPNNCTKTDNGCQTYTLSAILSTGTTYSKSNLN